MKDTLYDSAIRPREDGKQPLYKALIRIPLYMGIEKSALMAEVGFCAFVVYLYQFQLLSFVLMGCVFCAVHPMLVLMYRRDAQLPALLFRHLRQKSLYLPYADALSRRPRPKRSLHFK